MSEEINWADKIMEITDKLEELSAKLMEINSSLKSLCDQFNKQNQIEDWPQWKRTAYNEMYADGHPHVKPLKVTNTAMGKPLTLEQLERKDGNPVWVIGKDFQGRETKGEWNILHLSCDNFCKKAIGLKTNYPIQNYGKTWLAYEKTQMI